jgi:hypothetical protein
MMTRDQLERFRNSADRIQRSAGSEVSQLQAASLQIHLLTEILDRLISIDENLSGMRNE